MSKYIVETLGLFRQIHVVEADSEDAALSIAKEADDNWQEYLGEVKIDINQYTPEQIKVFKEKQYFWDGVSFRDVDGKVNYKFETH